MANLISGIPKEKLLDSIRIAAPCKADWDSMTGDAQVRFCGQCKLNVYNLSEMTRQEATDLIVEKEGNLCVRLYRRADGTLITQDCPVGLRKLRAGFYRVAAAIAGFVSFILSTSCAFAKDETTDENLTLLDWAKQWQSWQEWQQVSVNNCPSEPTITMGGSIVPTLASKDFLKNLLKSADDTEYADSEPILATANIVLGPDPYIPQPSALSAMPPSLLPSLFVTSLPQDEPPNIRYKPIVEPQINCFKLIAEKKNFPIISTVLLEQEVQPNIIRLCDLTRGKNTFARGAYEPHSFVQVAKPIVFVPFSESTPPSLLPWQSDYRPFQYSEIIFPHKFQADSRKLPAIRSMPRNSYPWGSWYARRYY